MDEKLLAYPLGTKILMKELEFNTGGGGTNVAATFAKQELKTGYIGKVGKDVHGKLVFDWLQQNNITYLGQVGGQTGYSIILDSQEEDRTILAFKGSNNDISFDAIRRDELDAPWFYSCSMVGKSWETLVKLFAVAKNRNMKVAWNPANYVVEKGLEYVKEPLSRTDVLILNKEEAELLVGAGEAIELAERLLQHGPSLVTVSDGAHGVTVRATGEWGEQKFHLQPAQDLKIVETTGAGDAFGSGFIAGLIIGRDVRGAALQGMLNAEGVIQAYGCKEHIADRAEMDRWLAEEQQKKRHVFTEF